MPRKKPLEVVPDDGEPSTPPGESLPPLEDMIRKLSGRFREEIEVEEDHD